MLRPRIVRATILGWRAKPESLDLRCDVATKNEINRLENVFLNAPLAGSGRVAPPCQPGASVVSHVEHQQRIALYKFRCCAAS